MVQTALVKYVFLDVVGFTRERSVEAQTDIVKTLNSLVKESLAEVANKVDSIFLPTGDGMCIALIASESEWDLNLRVALELLARLQQHNQSTEDAMRRFELRIGLNENVDNLVTDINGSRNVAG